jgi:L-rhamnose 1-dehydrogenase
MSALLSGKVAAITGGVTGIGRAVALAYVQQGASVAVNHLDDEGSEQQFKSMGEELGELSKRLISVPGDITKPETAKRLVEGAVAAFGKLDVFVSNAGICQFAEFLT